MIKQNLHAAADLIEQTGWTQGTYARDEQGNPCFYLSLDARCFCVMGAISLVCLKDAYKTTFALSEYVKDRVDLWNDEIATTKEQVVSTLRACAEAYDEKR